PSVFGFLAAIKPEGVAIMTDINAYLDFVLVIFLAFGVSFELPVALVILVLLGWVTPEQLRAGRGYAIVGIFVVAAVITPPDVVSQLLLAVPMCLLYEAGIIAARILGRRNAPDATCASRLRPPGDRKRRATEPAPRRCRRTAGPTPPAP